MVEGSQVVSQEGLTHVEADARGDYKERNWLVIPSSLGLAFHPNGHSVRRRRHLLDLYRLALWHRIT